MEDKHAALIEAAAHGDIQAFQTLFAPFQASLKAYLYRLTANRADAEDLTHDTFIRAFEKASSFRAEASIKTWVFAMATNLARNLLARRRRWTETVSADAKAIVQSHPALAKTLVNTAQSAPQGSYEIREHIDTCFTCMGKTLPLEQQLCLLLKDVHGFSVPEIQRILQRTEGQVKHRLQKARQTLTEVFQRRCALVNKNGVCHQCSELNGWFNPKQDQQAARMRILMHRERTKADPKTLFRLREALVRSIDPLDAPGSELQERLMDCNRMASGELPLPKGKAEA